MRAHGRSTASEPARDDLEEAKRLLLGEDQPLESLFVAGDLLDNCFQASVVFGQHDPAQVRGNNSIIDDERRIRERCPPVSEVHVVVKTAVVDGRPCSAQRQGIHRA